ncbi:hypothetical protein WA026_004710 [Henosepilachna vigintioctopunctata]
MTDDFLICLESVQNMIFVCLDILWITSRNQSSFLSEELLKILYCIYHIISCFEKLINNFCAMIGRIKIDPI